MNEQREVVLPCGHQYLADSLGVTVLNCPACNVTHTMDLRDAHTLPPHLDLQEPRACPVHGDPLRMWCEDCMEPACGLCAFDKHPMQTHSLVRAITFIRGVKKDLLTNSHRMLRQTSLGMFKNENAFHECEAKLIELFEENKALHQLNNDLRVLIPAVESATGVRPLHRAEKELKRIQAKAWTFPFIHECTLEENTDGGASSRVQTSNEGLNCAMGTLGLWVGQVGGGRARLTWDGDKLLLCAFSGSSPHPQPVLQLLAVDSLGSPEFPEVFLELSVGKQPLGIVYIKLWGHLRRAQNFILLCMGTLGPSFVGSHLQSVTMRGTANESVGAGMYRDTKGEMTAMPLLTALEWGGEYQTPVSKGLLVASSGGKPEVDCLYSIITGEGAEGGFSSCKFGWVSSGLEYVREATLYDPVEHVWISQCGLVLPRHTM